MDCGGMENCMAEVGPIVPASLYVLTGESEDARRTARSAGKRLLKFGVHQGRAASEGAGGSCLWPVLKTDRSSRAYATRTTGSRSLGRVGRRCIDEKTGTSSVVFGVPCPDDDRSSGPSLTSDVSALSKEKKP